MREYDPVASIVDERYHAWSHVRVGNMVAGVAAPPPLTDDCPGLPTTEGTETATTLPPDDLIGVADDCEQVRREASVQSSQIGRDERVRKRVRVVQTRAHERDAIEGAEEERWRPRETRKRPGGRAAR